ncbi:IclR family transcriptional regulator [Prauserella cavernicola]|uniref:Glycerol operon regulatory protein n=1 Tax=Prauserella cavernicola TaxID=2800127 RepID=A0A934V3F9_9PSEU|nr:IclR family transcriptional regulator [Prauserella cavernicola]MBK1787241.1 IclR family transcriptional regulator [Prauserella cavernicola]
MTARPGDLHTVSRALQVLRAFTEDRPTRGVTELADELGLDKSQVQRILATLARQGFTVVDPATRRYTLGPALVQLGRQAEHSPGLRHQLEPHLEKLAAATGESVVVCVPDGFRYRTIAACDGPGMLRYATALGRSYPGHLGATGHAIFAFHPAASAKDLLGADGHEPDPDAVTDLTHRQEQVRQRGYSISEGEFDSRVMAVAAPVLLDGTLFGAVSVLGPWSYMTPNADELVDAVLASADQLGQALRPPAD